MKAFREISGRTCNGEVAFPVIYVTTVFEDAAACAQVQELCQRLARKAGPGVVFRICHWNFDALAKPQLRQLAALNAARADIVFMALRAELPLPAVVGQWLEEWLAQNRRGASALVALLNSVGHAPWRAAAIASYLRAAARKGQMDFFWSDGHTSP